jgi:GMP synthase (glutamine-hydrolysing)
VAERRPWLCIQHVLYEGPGLIADALAEAGSSLELRLVFVGDPLPASSELDLYGGLVVLGGPMSVHDDAAHEWLVPERALLRAAVDAGLVVLGVCLGAQQLASAFGAAVTTMASPEIGAGEVVLTNAGLADPVLGGAPSPLPVVHWHGETFGLPAGAVHLAETTHCAQQAFRIGTHAYGLQCHIEVDDALAAEWSTRLPKGTTLAGWPRAAQAAGLGVLRRLVSLADR